MKHLSKKWILIFSLIGLVTSLAWVYLGTGKDSRLIYQKDLQQHLAHQEEKILAYLEDARFTNYLLNRNEVRYLRDIERHLRKLRQLKTESFALYLVQDQSFQLVHTHLNLKEQTLQDLRTNQIEEGWHLQAGEAYLLKSYTLNDKVQAWVWIPVLAMPPSGSLSFLEKENHQQLSFKDYPPIYLAGPQKAVKRSLLLYLICFFAFFIWFSSNAYLAAFLKREAYPKYLGLLLGSFGLFSFLLLGIAQLNQQDLFSIEWIIWAPILNDLKVGPSPILILVQSVLVFWLFSQFYRLFGKWELPVLKYVSTSVLIAYLLSLILLLAVGSWLKHLILSSNIFLNLEATLQLTQQGFLVALSLVLLLLAVFLFVFRLFKWISKGNLSFSGRLLLMLLALVFSIPLVLWLDLDLSVWTWGLMGFIFLMLFDLLSDGETFNFTWLMVWLMMMSAFAASLSYKYVLTKDLQTMQTYSHALLEATVTDVKELNSLEFINRYAYLILDDGEPVSSQQFITDLGWEDLKDLPEGEFFQNKTAQYLSLAQKQGQKLVVLQKNIGNYFSPLALFALFFMLFILVILGFVGLHLIFPVLPAFLYGVFSVKHSLKNRIQLAVIGIVLGSSILIGAVTVWYFKSTTRLEQQQNALATMKVFQQKWNSIEQLDTLQRKLLQGQNGVGLEAQQATFYIYKRSGEYLMSNKPQQDIPQWMSAQALESLKLQLQPYIFDVNQHQRETLYTTLKNTSGQIIAYLAVPNNQSNSQMEQQLNNFVGSIFSLYVFFMFIAGGIAIWVANSITEPISKIGTSLSQLRLESNTPLVWENEDEIGLLIQQYNLALKKLEESSRQLRLSEREGAWREMAKQVAHEIKNPLTPMKLSVQHLLRAYQMNPDSVGPLIGRVSTTLIEQIEGLTKIADEFAHFAKMPKADPTRLPIHELLQSIVDLYTDQASNTEVQLELPSFAVFVMADKDQLMRVFHNLLTNALQAIPSDRKGLVKVGLEQIGAEVKISVADNGLGIPEALQDQVFYPNFTTKSSGTGIGLSMSRNIIEQFGGQIYFETRQGVGTTFYIALAAC